MVEVLAAEDSIQETLIQETWLLARKVKLRQLTRGFRAGTDAVLLAAAAPVVSGLVLDAGAATGAVGLSYGIRAPNAHIGLIEIDDVTAGLARENIALNGMESRAQVFHGNFLNGIGRRGIGLASDMADLVLSNPPYLDPARARLSPDPDKIRAHAMSQAGAAALEAWIKACVAMLRPGGTFVMVHRADALMEILDFCQGRLGALSVMPIHSKADENAIRVLVRGKKGSRAPLSLAPPFVLHEADGSATPRSAAVHRGDAVLEWPE